MTTSLTSPYDESKPPAFAASICALSATVTFL
jgi:hypothetical protein